MWSRSRPAPSGVASGSRPGIGWRRIGDRGRRGGAARRRPDGRGPSETRSGPTFGEQVGGAPERRAGLDQRRDDASGVGGADGPGRRLGVGDDGECVVDADVVADRPVAGARRAQGDVVSAAAHVHGTAPVDEHPELGREPVARGEPRWSATRATRGRVSTSSPGSTPAVGLASTLRRSSARGSVSARPVVTTASRTAATASVGMPRTWTLPRLVSSTGPASTSARTAASAAAAGTGRAPPGRRIRISAPSTSRKGSCTLGQVPSPGRATGRPGAEDATPAP